MKRQLFTLATTAAATTALILTALWPASLAATGKDPGPAPVITLPTLKVNGCELSVRPAKESYAPGDVLTVEFRMANPSPAPAAFEAFVVMNDQEPGAEFSRRGPSSTQVWIESVPVSLAPGETKIVILNTGTKAQARHGMNFVIKCKDKVLVGGHVFIPPVAAANPNPIPNAVENHAEAK